MALPGPAASGPARAPAARYPRSAAAPGQPFATLRLAGPGRPALPPRSRRAVHRGRFPPRPGRAASAPVSGIRPPVTARAPAPISSPDVAPLQEAPGRRAVRPAAGGPGGVFQPSAPWPQGLVPVLPAGPAVLRPGAPVRRRPRCGHPSRGWTHASAVAGESLRSRPALRLPPPPSRNEQPRRGKPGPDAACAAALACWRSAPGLPPPPARAAVGERSLPVCSRRQARKAWRLPQHHSANRCPGERLGCPPRSRAPCGSAPRPRRAAPAAGPGAPARAGARSHLADAVRLGSEKRSSAGHPGEGRQTLRKRLAQAGCEEGERCVQGPRLGQLDDRFDEVPWAPCGVGALVSCWWWKGVQAGRRAGREAHAGPA